MRRIKVTKQKMRKLDHRSTETTRSRRIARATCVCGYGTEISWWWPWCISVVTAGIRIHYVMLPENWWILHPDEIFQSVEVAFSEVYGYGFRPYEYLPAPNDTNTAAEAQLLQSGMYGLRSSIYPKIFMIVLSIARMSGIDHSAFMVCRIFNVVITSLLPVTVYWFVLNIFNCRLLAFLTCALSAVEHHLAVFGTHTIVNSFISPGIFAGLALTLRRDELTGKGKEECQQLADETSDQNGNIISNRIKNWKPVCDLEQSNQMSPGKKESAANHDKGVKQDWLLLNFLGGYLLGVTCYIRPDGIMFCLSVTLSVLCMKRQFVHQYLMKVTVTLIGGVAACTCCVADDFSWYGWGVPTPIQWFNFNIISGKSGKLYGIQGAQLYLQVFTDRAADLVMILTFAAILIYSKSKQADTFLLPRMFGAIFFSFVSNVLLFSSTGHKEKRFIHNIIVLYLLLVSYGLHTLISLIRRRYSNLTCSSLITVSFVISFAVLSFSRFPTVNTPNISDWTYGEPRDSVDVNTCLDWLRRQSDVNGVYINASLYDTAGFTILKHDVPLLVKIHNEFYLFDGARERTLRKNSRIRTILDYSNFIHESNKLYLARVLSKDKLFNYVITKNEIFSLPSIKYMYNKVFIHGLYSVFRTDFSSPKGSKLVEKLPAGNNATVLEYEANWLITNGLYQLAIERIEGALKVDNSRVRLYHQMFVCYYKLNDTPMLFHYQEECFRRFGKQTCVKQQDKVVLHEDYKKFHL